MVYVYGSINADIVVFTDKFVKSRETVFGKNYIVNQGGKGANQAIAASRLGADSIFIGRVGKDNFGSFVKEELNRYKTRNYIIQDENSRTGIALIEVNSSGENRIIVVSGANKNTGKEELEYLKNIFKFNDLLLLQGEISFKQNLFTTKIFKGKGIIIFDPAPVDNKMFQILSLVDFVTPNEIEFELLYQNLKKIMTFYFRDDQFIKIIESSEFSEFISQSGLTINYVIELYKKSKFLIENGVKNLIVKLGEKGIFFINKNFCFYQNSYKVKAIDSTAAGDTFNGAFAFYLDNILKKNKRISKEKAFKGQLFKDDLTESIEYILKNQNKVKTFYIYNTNKGNKLDNFLLFNNFEIEKACIFAQIAASFSVTKKGAAISSPDMDDLIRFVSK